MFSYKTLFFRNQYVYTGWKTEFLGWLLKINHSTLTLTSYGQRSISMFTFHGYALISLIFSLEFWNLFPAIALAIIDFPNVFILVRHLNLDVFSVENFFP